MKKALFTFLWVVSWVLATAQITISNTDMPVPGYRAWLSTPDTLLQIDPAPTGPGFIWDFSILTYLTQRKDTFVNPSAVDFLIRAQFFSADVVRLQDGPDSLAGFALGDGFRFFNTTSSVFENMGVGGNVSGLPLALRNNPGDILYRFPLNYGDEDSSESVAELSVPGLFFIRQERKRHNLVDGWGNLKTPYGSFDVLRVQSTITGRDSISLDTLAFSFSIPGQREYKWLAKEEAVPLLQINAVFADSIGELATSVTYVDSLRDTVAVALEEDLSTSGVTLYPNPANESIHIAWKTILTKPAELKILSLDGKWVQSLTLYPDTRELDVSGLASGMYLIRIQLDSGMYHGKLNIIH